jgi:F0F1-type ATP synthase alpha subunit
MVNNQLFTGILLIDYISPLYTGNMNLLYGSANLGQKQILQSTAISYTKDNYIIYVTYSKKESLLLKAQFDKNGMTNYTIFNLSDSPSETEYYYMPRVALSLAKQLIANKQSVLFCFDDITTYIFKEKNVSETSKAYVFFYNFSHLITYFRMFLSYVGNLKIIHSLQL